MSARSAAPVLVATSRRAVADAVARLTAAVHVDMAAVEDAHAVRGLWSDAALVLIGDDVAASLPAVPPRRDGVVLVTDCRSAGVLEYALAVGAERVVVLPDDEPWLVERLVSAGGDGRDGLVVGVTPVRGGAGASTMATALARCAARQQMSVVVVDADPLGGDIDVALAVTGEPGLRWSDLRQASGRLPADALAGALPARHGVAVVVHDCDPHDEVPSPEALRAVTQALRRAYDLVVLDLPRSLASVGTSTVGGGALVLVTTNDVRGSRAVERMAARVDSLSEPSLVVRTCRRWGADPQGLADAAGLRLAATLRQDGAVARDLERGDFVLRRSLRRAARGLLGDLASTRGALHR